MAEIYGHKRTGRDLEVAAHHDVNIARYHVTHILFMIWILFAFGNHETFEYVPENNESRREEEQPQQDPHCAPEENKKFFL